MQIYTISVEVEQDTFSLSFSEQIQAILLIVVTVFIAFASYN